MKPPLAALFDAGRVREAHRAGGMVTPALGRARLVEFQRLPAIPRVSAMRRRAAIFRAGQLNGTS